MITSAVKFSLHDEFSLPFHVKFLAERYLSLAIFATKQLPQQRQYKTSSYLTPADFFFSITYESFYS